MDEQAVLTDACQVTVAWLTRVLKEKGALVKGRVGNVTAEPMPSTNSRMARLHLSYEKGTEGDLPASLMLKIVLTEPGEFGPSEVDYYTRDYVDLPDAPILTCYHAAYSAGQHAYHLLLEDLTTTHRANWETTPTPAYGRSLAEALAILHAHWWKKVFAPAAQIERYMAEVRPGFEPLLAYTKGDIPAAWIEALHRIMSEHPAAMHARLAQGDHLTLVHGDPNPGNILTPIAGNGRLYLVDRQPFDWSFTEWLGVSDLAYLMALRWEPELRQQLEMEVLRHYHAVLRRRGATGYSWEQLLYDYKLSVMQMVYVPIDWCVTDGDRERMKWLWSAQLERVMTAVFELDCMGLLVG
jgi:thiamine kinase-like enzyme